MSSQSLDGGVCSTDYDAEMVTPDYLMGINYPASLQVRERSALHGQPPGPAAAVQSNCCPA